MHTLLASLILFPKNNKRMLYWYHSFFSDYLFYYTRFFFRKKGYINFVPKAVRRPSVRLSVRLCVCASVTFLVIVSPPKPLEVATSNFVGE